MENDKPRFINNFTFIIRLLNETPIFKGTGWRYLDSFTVGSNSPNVLGFLNICLYTLFTRELSVDRNGNLVEREYSFGATYYKAIMEDDKPITFRRP